MTGVPKRSVATAPFLVGTFLFLCALTFYYFAVLEIDYQKTTLLNLGPYPDAVEYFAQAKAILKDGWPSIQIGYDKLPSRYPFGYPALMLPWLKILPEADSILAPFRTNQTIGLFLLFGVFGFYLCLAKPLAGGCTTLLLATLPGFFTYCRSSMSEISMSALIVLAFMFAYLGLTEERRWKIYLSAVLLGLSLNIRTQSIFFAPLLLAMVLFPAKGTWLRWSLHCATVPIVFALAASPMLLMNTIQFHSPLKSGYNFWSPYWLEHHRLFSQRYVVINLTHLWKELTLQPVEFTVANIFGTGTVIVPAFMLLVCVGFFFIRVSRFVVCSLLAGLSFFAGTAAFRFSQARLYLPLLVLLVPVAVVSVRWAGRNLFVLRRTIAAIAILVLYVAACAGYPSRSGYNTVKANRSQTVDALHFSTPIPKSPHFIAQKHFVELCGRQPGIVLSDVNPVYLNALLPRPFVAAPIDGKHSYKFSKIWHYDRPEALALVKRGLGQSLPVYALFIFRREMEEKAGRLPQVDGHDWVLLENSTAEAAILRLCPRGQ